jgi:hypothetical protein
MVQGAAAVADACTVCGSATPDPGCWLCGWSWVADASADQAAADQAEAAERAEAEAAVFDLMRQVARAESRVAWLATWARRLREVLDHWQAGHGRRRVVLLVADLLARDAAARTSARGRRGHLPEVAAILAVDARPEVGRAAMPGRYRTAILASCSTRAVTAGWARAVQLGWARRTARGRVLPARQRAETLRLRDRAAYELVALSDGDAAARAAYIPAAIAVLEGLLARTTGLLRAAHADLDALVGRPDPARSATRARVRAAAQRTLDASQAARMALSDRLAHTLTSPPPTRALTRAGISSPLSVGDTGMSTCSGLEVWVSDLSRGITIHSPRCRFRPFGRERSTGAPPTHQGRNDLGCVCRNGRTERPRQPGVPGRRPRRTRPEWADWAYPLARQLRHVLDLVAGAHPTRLAATLGGHLAPCQPDGAPWDVTALVDVIEACGGALPTSAAAPLALLRSRIGALPDRYRRPDQVTAERRAVVRDQAAELAARRAAHAREHEHQAAAVAASDPARTRLARRLARYAIRPADTTGCCVGCDTRDQVTGRPYAGRTVPLCGTCHDLLADTGQD